MKMLVTGGAGFIGRHLVKSLIETGNDVSITATGNERIPSGVKHVFHSTLAGINWKQIEGFDVVYHQAANNDTRCLDREEMQLANVESSERLLHRAFNTGCKIFVYASSTAVYGNSPAPYTEKTAISPLNPYAESKADFDKLAMEYGDRYKVPVIGLRYCNVYGPGEQRKGSRMSMIGQIIRLFQKEAEYISLFEDGTQRRDWVYVDDIVQANMTALQGSIRSGEIFNIGSGQSISFNDLVEIIREEYARAFRKEYNARPWMKSGKVVYKPCPFEQEYQSHTECCIDKARKMLGYSPNYDFRKGIRAYLDSVGP